MGGSEGRRRVVVVFLKGGSVGGGRVGGGGAPYVYLIDNNIIDGPGLLNRPTKHWPRAPSIQGPPRFR